MRDSGDAPKMEISLHSIRMEIGSEFAVQVPDGEGAECPLVLALHGWGQTCVEFSEFLSPIGASGMLVVAPQAPNALYVDRHARRVGFSWLTRYRRDEAVADINAHLDSVLGAVERIHAFDRERLYLLGFSQGASVAYRYAMAATRPIAGLVACSADLPPDVAVRLRERPAFRVLLVHGLKDRIVPPTAMRVAQDTLVASGYPVATHTFPGGHRITAGAAQAIAEWINGSGDRR